VIISSGRLSRKRYYDSRIQKDKAEPGSISNL